MIISMQSTRELKLVQGTPCRVWIGCTESGCQVRVLVADVQIRPTTQEQWDEVSVAMCADPGAFYVEFPPEKEINEADSERQRGEGRYTNLQPKKELEANG